MLKRIMALMLAVLIFTSAGFADSVMNFSAAAAGKGDYIITTDSDNLRIRESASSSAKQVGSVPSGKTVEVTKVSGNWGKITYDGVTGWISLDYAFKVGSVGDNPTKNNILKGLEALEKKFPDGKYWNHYGSSKANPDGWTNTPCPSGHYLNGVQQCNGQCDGFARKVAKDIFGLSTYSWKETKYDINTVCVGDIIRYNGKHTIMVVGFTDYEDELIITDCNWDYACGIRWNAYFDTSRYFRNINWVMHYPGNNFNRDAYLNSSVKINLSEYTISAGREFTLKVSTLPAYLEDYTAWTSSNPAVATVSSKGDTKGKVTAISEGTAIITATSPSGGSDSCVVTVTGAVDIKRLAGDNRTETAVQISKTGWNSTGAENIIIANGYSYADALAGVPLSKALNAPILLTSNTKNGMEKSNLEQMKKLGAKNVYILGGDFVVSGNIEKKLKESGYNVIRLAGQTRFETSVAIAEKLNEISGASSQVFLATGYGYADVLSAGSIAAILKSPIIFTLPDGGLDASIKEYLKENGITKANLIGGTYVIPEKVNKELSGCGVKDVKRYSGTNRYDTCLEVVKAFDGKFKGEGFVLATGADFPDALAGGALAAKRGIPLMLATSSPSGETIEWLKNRDAQKMYVLGGQYAVDNETMYLYTA